MGLKGPKDTKAMYKAAQAIKVSESREKIAQLLNLENKEVIETWLVSRIFLSTSMQLVYVNHSSSSS